MTAEAAHVALFRNLNLGHPGSLTGDELIEAFGGPGAASGFQTNGTVVFQTMDAAVAATEARRRLAEAGYRQDCVIRSLEQLRGIVEEAAAVPVPADVYRVLVSFFDVPESPVVDDPPPLRSRDGLVEVSVLAPGHAISLCWKPGSTAGNATALLERLLGTPVTTRTLGTLERLVARNPT